MSDYMHANSCINTRYIAYIRGRGVGYGAYSNRLVHAGGMASYSKGAGNTLSRVRKARESAKGLVSARLARGRISIKRAKGTILLENRISAWLCACVMKRALTAVNSVYVHNRA